MTNKEVIETLRYIKYYKADKDSDEPYALDLAIKALEERPQGDWRKHSTFKDVLICSNCNYGSNQVYDTFKFCPNCGAYMKE